MMPAPIAITRTSPPMNDIGETSAAGSSSFGAMSMDAGNGSLHAMAGASGTSPGASNSHVGFGGGASFSRSSTLNGKLSTTPSGALGASFHGSGSAGYREAIARSFGKDAADIMDYSIARFSSSHASTDSNMTALPSTSLPRNKLETTFCRNFKCCGIQLENLHDLLQHYEEAHVKFEDDEVPAMVDDDQSAASSSATSSQPPSPKSSAAPTATASHTSLPPLAPVDDSSEHLSAFDTTVMRSPIKGSKKRSFGQFSNAGASSGALHQSLRRALIDGGIGRSRENSVYSAGSAFSTPTSSIPGTPIIGDVDTEAAFFGNGANPAAFSALSIRGNEDHNLPSCAPPNLFFPAVGAAGSMTMGAGAATNVAALQQSKMGLGVGMPNKTQKTLAGANASLDSSVNNASFYSDRPYKCTSPGCDKAYKQMNGLKYHRLHGQCNQNMMSAANQVSNAVDKNVAGGVAGLKAGTGSTSPATNDSESGSGDSTSSDSSPGSPQSGEAASTDAGAAAALAANQAARDAAKQQMSDKIYICQVGNCGKRYKNLNGLRYHYLHSGSHGMLGLQLLHSNGGGASARADATTGRPAVSTNDLSSDALKAVARAAAEQQALHQRNAKLKQQEKQAGGSGASSSSPESQPKSGSSAGPMPIPLPTAAAAAAH